MVSINKFVAGMRGVAKRAAVGVVACGMSVAAFAQTSTTSTSSTTFDPAPIVTSVNSVVPALVAVGGAVIGVVTVAWGIKMVRTFLGR